MGKSDKGAVTSGPATLENITIKTYIQRDGTPVPKGAEVFLQQGREADGSPRGVDRGVYRIVVGAKGLPKKVSRYRSEGDWEPRPDTELSLWRGFSYRAVWVAAGKGADIPEAQILDALPPTSFTPEKRDLKARRLRVPKSFGSVTVLLQEPRDEAKFAFDDATVGVCRIRCEAQGGGESKTLPKAFEDKIRWSISSSQGSGDALGSETKVRWVKPDTDTDQTWPGDSTQGRGTQVELRLEGLPRRYAQLGRKRIVMEVPDLGIRETRDVRLFFARDARNHPGKETYKGEKRSGEKVTRRYPNWFYYYQQTKLGDPGAELGALPEGKAGVTPAMRHWKERALWQSKKQIIVNEDLMTNFGRYRDYSVGPVHTPGLTLFAYIVAHEGRHVWQIRECDAALEPHHPEIAEGWSFGVGKPKNVSSVAYPSWNHVGKDGQRLDGLRRDAAGNGQDIPDDLDLKTSGLFEHLDAIENDACSHADGSISPKQHAKQDWAYPGDQWSDGEA